MREVTVLVDKSGSMKVLGKEAICDDLLKFLKLYPLINSCEAEIVFISQDWDGNSDTLEEVISRSDYLMILTDGYSCNDHCESVLEKFCVDTLKNIVIVLVGSDAYFKKTDSNSRVCSYMASEIDSVVSQCFRG